jgi:hypothetical protein
MLVFWAPFWGSHRLPSVILPGIGRYLFVRQQAYLPGLRTGHRWTVVFRLL